MKHLFLIRDFPPNKPGGMNNYYWGILHNLDPSNTVVLTICAENHRSGNKIDLDVPFEVIRTKVTEKKVKRFLTIFTWVLHGLSLIKKNGYNLIHCGNFRPFGYVSYILSKFTGCNYLCYFHGNDILGLEKSLRKKSIKAITFRKIINNAFGFVVNSEYTKNLLIKRIGVEKSKIIVVLPGVREEFLDKSVTFPEFGKDQSINLITVGRLVRRKGVDKVIEAVGELIKDGYDVRYFIVGPGDKTRYIEKINELNLHDKVIFPGYLNHLSEVMEWYQKSHIFLMPSRIIEEESDVEGFGIVYLEAAALKQPVIAAKTGGIPEAVIDGVTGLLVEDPHNVTEIQRAIMTLIRSPEYALLLAKQSYNRIKNEFTWFYRVNLFRDKLEKLFVNI